MSDTEGNDFGLVKPNGKPLKKTAEVGKLALRLNDLYHVYDAAERKSDVAIFMSRQINHIMGSEGMTDNHCNSLCGANFMLSDGIESLSNVITGASSIVFFRYSASSIIFWSKYCKE